MTDTDKECRMVQVDFNDVIERALLAYDAAMSEESTREAALGLAAYIVSDGLGISIRAAVLMVKEAVSKNSN